MTLFENIIRFFDQQNQANSQLFEEQTPYIAEAANLITHSLAEGGKVITCSCDKSGAAAEYLANHLMHSPYIERPGLPSMYLGAACHQKLTHQIETLAAKQDVVILFANKSHNNALHEVIRSADTMGVQVIAVSSHAAASESIRNWLPDNHVCIDIVSASVDDTIQHLMIAYLLAQLTEQELFGISL